MTETLSSSNDIESGANPDCPYKGLLAYTEADAEYFFGRDSDRELVIDNLMASRLTVLYGPSGVGKSSLLQAGVMPLLRQIAEGAFSYLAVEDAVVVYFASWRRDPLRDLGGALLRAVPTDLVSDLLAERPALSPELLRVLTSRLGSYVYLLLDQFEEQTFYQADSEGEAFLAELGQIITTPGLRASVLLGIREDALAKLDRLEDYVPGHWGNNLRLHPLNRAAAKEAIEGPLIRYNASVSSARHVTIEPELINDLLYELQTGVVSLADPGWAGMDPSGESFEMTSLQLVMTKLWAEEANRDSLVLRRDTLASLGGADQIVRTNLDAVMAQLTEQQQQRAASIFRYLVTTTGSLSFLGPPPDGTKTSYTAGDLADILEVADPAQASDVLEKLAAIQVLRRVPPPHGSNDPPRYEILHEAMVPAVLDWRSRYVERQRIANEQARILASQELELRKARKQLRLYALLCAALALLLFITTVIIALEVTQP
jgi:hypothetical protein